MNTEVIFSFIIPTYNSARTINECLAGIRNQEFDQDLVEILVVDGGSTDCTLEVAAKYNAIVVNNPDRLPEPAKLHGMRKATGKYIVIMGSDEIMKDKTLLKRRFEFLQRHPKVHGLLAELKAPKDYLPLCHYMNAVGDPFTCFVYKTFGDRKYNLRKHLVESEDGDNLYSFTADDIIPIGDGGTVIDFTFLKENYKDEIEQFESSIVWDMLIRDTGYVGVVENDYVEHLSTCDIKTYVKKLKFRIVNNIHNVAGSGYALRATTNNKLNRRKYLFPIYCLLLPWPLLDGVLMAVRHKHWVFLTHIIWSWYVLLAVAFEYAKKLIGKTSQNSVYGK